jgi:hypothetical protein
MQFLASKFRSQPVAQPTGAELVDKYCDRATHATLIEDRRAAVLGLKGLAHEYKLDVGIKGMSVLLDILKQDIMDSEITKAVLEALTILCSPEDSDEKEETETKNKEKDDLSIQFTEILIKDPKNVTTLLQALEGNDFYVRYFTIQLLNALMNNKPNQLQTCILTSPMGVSRLIDLLDDKREIIRNEGLLLLISLSRSNAEIQKIIAFENAFEKLLSIILQEGVTDGGIVVQDCLQLTHNLLRYNVSNQNLFRESSCIQVLPKLLVSRVQGPKNTLREISLIDPENEWTDQKIINATLILGLIRILVVPNNPNTTVNQNVMFQCKIMDILIDLAFCPRIPNKLKCQAFYAIADIIRGNTTNQDSFAKHVIRSGEVIDPTSPVITSPRRTRSQSKFDLAPPPLPILLILVQIILTPSKNDEFSIRAAAAYTFQCYVNNNPDGQLALLTTLMPPPEDNPNDEINDKPQTPGTIILSSLLEWNTTRKDPYKTWFAAVLLSHILMKNEQCKLMALKLNLYEYDEQISLLHKCMYSYITATKENVDVRVLIGFLCLIAVWLYDCPKAVSEFLKEDAHISILIEEIIQSSDIDIAVQGLAAFLFGICYEFNDGSEPSFSREKIQPIVLNRIGADVFISRFERLKESEYIEKVSPYLQIIAKDVTSKDNLPNLYFDYSFIELFKSAYGNISRSIIEPNKEEPDTVAIAMLKNKIEELEKKITTLNKESEEKDKKYEELVKDNENYQSIINKQNDELKQKSEMISSLEKKLLDQNVQSSNNIQELENNLKTKQDHINQQKNNQRSQQIESENYSSNLQLIELTNKNNELIKQLEKQKLQYKELEQEQDDLLVCLAEHDLEIKKLKLKLIDYGEKDIIIDDDDSDDDENNEEQNNNDENNEQNNNDENNEEQNINNISEINQESNKIENTKVNTEAELTMDKTNANDINQTNNVLESPVNYNNGNNNNNNNSNNNFSVQSEIENQKNINQSESFVGSNIINTNPSHVLSPQNVNPSIYLPTDSLLTPQNVPINNINSESPHPSLNSSLASPHLNTFTPPPLASIQQTEFNSSSSSPKTNNSLPPPPNDLLIQQQGGYNYNSRRHNRHQYANYVPNVSFLPQTQFNNNNSINNNEN